MTGNGLLMKLRSFFVLVSALFLAVVLMSAGSRTCFMCHGKSCPNASSSGVCNCVVFYRCPNSSCGYLVCDGCYYKKIRPQINKGCPVCKKSGQFVQVK